MSGLCAPRAAAASVSAMAQATAFATPSASSSLDESSQAAGGCGLRRGLRNRAAAIRLVPAAVAATAATAAATLGCAAAVPACLAAAAAAGPGAPASAADAAAPQVARRPEAWPCPSPPSGAGVAGWARLRCGQAKLGQAAPPTPGPPRSAWLPDLAISSARWRLLRRAGWRLTTTGLAALAAPPAAAWAVAGAGAGAGGAGACEGVQLSRARLLRLGAGRVLPAAAAAGAGVGAAGRVLLMLRRFEQGAASWEACCC